MAGEDKLSPSGLERITYQQQHWHSVVNRNADVIDYRLQKLERLLDVDTSAGLADGCVLGWHAVSSRWKPMNPVT